MITENPKTAIFVAYLAYGLGQLGLVGFNILLFRQFSLEEVGAYGLIVSLATFAGFAFDLGITQTLVRAFSQNVVSFSQAVSAALALRLPVLGLGLFTLPIWLTKVPSSGFWERLALLLAISAQFLMSFRAIAVSWLRAHNCQNLGNILNSLPSLGYLGIAVFLILLYNFRLVPLFSGLLLLEIAITLLSFWWVKKIQMTNFVPNRGGNLRSGLGALWKPSLIFFSVSFWAVVQSRLDWILVYALSSEIELAYYSLANKVYEVFESGVAVAITTTLPWVCKMMVSGEKNPRLMVGFKGIALASSISAVTAALWLPGFLSLFWGDKFAKADDLIFLLMCGAGLSTLCSLMYYLLVASNKEKYFLITGSVPALCQILANIILIPRYGNYGAVAGMLVLITTSFFLLSLICIKNHLIEHLGLFKNTMLLFVLIFAALLFGKYLKQSFVHTMIFFIVAAALGTLILFSKQERAIIVGELKGTFGFLWP